jgi:hypothetical protein
LFLPFDHFTRKEAEVLAESLIDHKSLVYHINNKIDFKVKPNVFQYLANEYIDDKSSGATGIEMIDDISADSIKGVCKNKYRYHCKDGDIELIVSIR